MQRSSSDVQIKPRGGANLSQGGLASPRGLCRIMTCHLYRFHDGFLLSPTGLTFLGLGRRAQSLDIRWLIIVTKFGKSFRVLAKARRRRYPQSFPKSRKT